ncbi:hypothetical protein ACS0TY_010252 [Phlomoides rotata]
MYLQSEYKRGISGWNFNLQDMMAQASLVSLFLIFIGLVYLTEKVYLMCVHCSNFAVWLSCLIPMLKLHFRLVKKIAFLNSNLLALHRTTTLCHDELGQETHLNLLLRNYLHYNLYDQAEKLRSKAPQFEAHSNQQFSRYLFYLGKIRKIQLEYTDAKESLLQAARKAPVSALGFRVQCNKWAIIVHLLLGEIPERTVFMQKWMEKALRP